MRIPQRYQDYIVKRAEEDLERILRSITITDKGCWEWSGSKNEEGYGKVSVLGFQGMAHRIAYEFLRGEIPEGHHLDHLDFCRNHSCINPDHVEPVPPKVNSHRGLRIRACEAGATHCPAGHELIAGNVWIGKTGWQYCQKCRSTRIAERRAAKVKDRPPIPRGAHMAAKTHCPRGHEYAGDNLIVDKRGSRHCRACKNESRHRDCVPRPEITHCRQGHEYTPENTYWRGKNGNTKVCRTCSKAQVEAVRQKCREANPPRPLGCGQASKTHCRQGHAYDEANTGRTKTGGRYCRACARDRARARREQKE